MPKYFPGVTHCKVITPTSAVDMDAMNGTIAMIALCFGTDEDSLQPIRIKRVAGTSSVVFELPQSTVIYNGRKIQIPMLRGKAAEEAKITAGMAFDKVKQQFGLKFGKTYRVFGNKIEEVGEANGPGTAA